MRINWIVPVRALWSLLRWFFSRVNVWAGVIISIPLFPIIWLVVMIAIGARRVGRMIKRSMRHTDHELSDVLIDLEGWVYGQVDGDMTALGLFAECNFETQLTKRGLVIKSRHGKTFLVKSLSREQKYAPLTEIFAESFLR